MKLKLPEYLLGQAHAISVTVIGAGGTGSILLQHLARINRAMISLGTKGMVVTCIDSDIVSLANIGRQLYTLNDIGRPKADVMIERINRFYGTNWFSIPENFDLPVLNMNNFPGNIVISCVDNIKTRRFISAYIKRCHTKRWREQYKNYFWIDTGNGKNYGQVICGSQEFKLPDVFDIFPGLKEDRKSKLPSCSLAEALKSQDLFINSDVALIAAKFVWEVVTQSEIDWHGAYINQNKLIPVRKIPIPQQQLEKTCKSKLKKLIR